MPRASTKGMRRITGKDGRKFWIETATGRRTTPGKPLSKPQPRAAGGQFQTKGGTGKVIGKDREGRPVYKPPLAPVRGEGGKFAPHPVKQAAERLRQRTMSVSDYRKFAGAYGLTERQLWAIYEAGAH